jgi:hypothetical protein
LPSDNGATLRDFAKNQGFSAEGGGGPGDRMQGFAEIASAVVSFAKCSVTFVPCFPSVCGIFIRRPAHLKGLGVDAKSDARLTWLSIRCLSSCLFSASS